MNFNTFYCFHLPRRMPKALGRPVKQAVIYECPTFQKCVCLVGMVCLRYLTKEN